MTSSVMKPNAVRRAAVSRTRARPMPRRIEGGSTKRSSSSATRGRSDTGRIPGRYRPPQPPPASDLRRRHGPRPPATGDARAGGHGRSRSTVTPSGTPLGASPCRSARHRGWRRSPHQYPRSRPSSTTHRHREATHVRGSWLDGTPGGLPAPSLAWGERPAPTPTRRGPSAHRVSQPTHCREASVHRTGQALGHRCRRNPGGVPVLDDEGIGRYA